MTHQAQQDLESRFIELQNSLSPEEWSDAESLLVKVNALEKTDVALAFRLMQRVKNIDPTESNLNKLEKLKDKALEEVPALATISSSETKNFQTFLGNAKSLSQRVADVFQHPSLFRLKQPFALFVLIPFFVFSFYQIVVASPGYESQAKLIVKEPDGLATLDPAMAFVSGFGVGGGNMDAELVKAFIYSNDMLMYLDNKIGLRSHYSSRNFDFFSRLKHEASQEKFLAYYLDKVLVELEEKSQIITVHVHAFEPDVAHLLAETIVLRAEWYINEVGHKLANEQLEFVKIEHDLVEDRLQNAKTKLLSFQRRHNLLDPQAEGLAMQQITYQLEGQISAKRAELNALRSSMSNSAPQVVQISSQLESMVNQLEAQRSRLTSQSKSEEGLPSDEDGLSVSQVLAQFSDYKINLELALQAYTSSQISLEKSRIEAYRQLKYLITVETPTIPQEAKYPRVTYNVTLFLAISLMVFGIGRIVLAIASELR